MLSMGDARAQKTDTIFTVTYEGTRKRETMNRRNFLLGAM